MTFRDQILSFIRISSIPLALALAPSVSFSQHLLMLSPGLEEGNESWFDATIGIENSGIVNGQEYFMPFVSTSSFPFYQSREAVSGEIVFRSQVYRAVPLSYECYSDVVVFTLRRPNNFYELIRLDTSSVTEFRIHGHLFRKFADRGSLKTPEGNGYYDILFESPAIDLIARRTKVRFANPYTGKIEYAEEDRFYFKVKDQWTRFSGKKSLNALVKNNKDMQAFLRTNKIDVSVAGDRDLEKIASFLGENPSLLAGL